MQQSLPLRRMVRLLCCVFVFTIGVVNRPLHAQEMEPSFSTDGIPFCVMPAPSLTSQGLRVEMSLAPPAENVPRTPYELGKYGRVALDYARVAKLDGNHIGMSAQALHVEHHLLFYSLGLSTDINNDGMFLLTAGLAHYQSGNAHDEPFVDAPFIRLRYQSSEDQLYVYSELETTMHFRSYLSGMAGIGVRVSPILRMIGGFHHTEFVMPTERAVRQVDGLQGILSWGM